MKKECIHELIKGWDDTDVSESAHTNETRTCTKCFKSFIRCCGNGFFGYNHTCEKIAPWNDPTVKWVCENHPKKEQSHRIWFFWRCGGAGMPEPTPENVLKGYIKL